MNPGPEYTGGRRPPVARQWTQQQMQQQQMRQQALPEGPAMALDEAMDEELNEEPEYVRRQGLMAWWLDLTAPPVPNRTLPIAERERLRKAELTSYSILAIFCFLIALVSNSLASPSTGEAVGMMALGLIIAGILNRIGRTRIAAYLIPSLMMLVIALAILGNRAGLDLILIRAYDLFVLPIFLTSLIGDRKAPWIFALIAIAFITGDFAVQHHALTNGQGAVSFDTIQYEINVVGWWGAINRSVALAIFAAFFGWLGARSVDNAIARADTAEELASLEHTVAEQRRQLEVGVQQILETHVRVANGDFSARAPMNQGNLLWQIAASLNNLLGRLQKAGQAEHQYRRTEDEMRRLAAAIDDAQAGKRPIWPAPSGTPADLIIERLAARGRRPAPPTPQAPPIAPMAGMSPTSPMLPVTGQHPVPPMPGMGMGMPTGLDARNGAHGFNGFHRTSGPLLGAGATGATGGQPPVPPPPFPMTGGMSGSLGGPTFRERYSPPPRTVSSLPPSGPLGPLTGPLSDLLHANGVLPAREDHADASERPNGQPAENPWFQPPEGQEP